jgi:hypothetical protein
MNIITPLCYTSDERLEYFTQYIKHVNKLNNLDKIHFLFFVEPDSENMVEMIPNHWNKTIFRNYYRFKPALNHFVAFNYCFEVLKLDYAFLLEDDIICSPDLYELSMYCLQNNLLNDSLLCTLNKHFIFEKDHSIYNIPTDDVILKLNGCRYLSGWVLGVTRNFWEDIFLKLWRMNITFDAVIDTYYKECKVISPLISRTNQIGKVGFHYTNDIWNMHGFSSIRMSNNKNIKAYNLINV